MWFLTSNCLSIWWTTHWTQFIQKKNLTHLRTFPSYIEILAIVARCNTQKPGGTQNAKGGADVNPPSPLRPPNATPLVLTKESWVCLRYILFYADLVSSLENNSPCKSCSKFHWTASHYLLRSERILEHSYTKNNVTFPWNISHIWWKLPLIVMNMRALVTSSTSFSLFDDNTQLSR